MIDIFITTKINHGFVLGAVTALTILGHYDHSFLTAVTLLCHTTLESKSLIKLHFFLHLLANPPSPSLPTSLLSTSVRSIVLLLRLDWAAPYLQKSYLSDDGPHYVGENPWFSFAGAHTSLPSVSDSCKVVN